MENKENVRIDLLKFRRKAYLSYPENSPERKVFLKTILQNELRLTEQDVPKEMINYLMAGDSIVLWEFVKKILLWFSAACLFELAGFYINSVISNLFVFVGGGCLYFSMKHVYNYYVYWKSMKTVKQYSNDMKKYMNRISNDIKRLDEPHGF